MDDVMPGFYRVEVNKTLWEVPIRYQNLTPLGSGAFGQVCKADDRESNIKVAIKKLLRPFHDDSNAKRTYREVRLLKHMNHINVIGLLDIFTPAGTVEEFNDQLLRDQVYLVTELMSTDLEKTLKAQYLDNDHHQLIIYQILNGLKYVHSAGIIHRDLKPGNLAMNEDCDMKILDFGLARQETDTMTGYVATRWYRAPEIILNWMHYSSSVDIWSVGCILGEMISGKPLFPGLNYMDQLTHIMRLLGTPGPALLAKMDSDDARDYIKALPQYQKTSFHEKFPHADPQALDLMEHMLDMDPDTRITAEQALAHDYLRRYADPEEEPTCDSKPYDQSFEEQKFDVQKWKELVFEETKNFVPRVPDVQ